MTGAPWRERVEIGPATLYLGDGRAIAPALAPFDAVVSDPPYGQALKANVTTRDRPDKRYPDQIIGDDAPFDPRWMLELAPAALIWGAHHFYRRLPEGGRWLVWDKRVGTVDTLAQADGEIAWTNRQRAGRSGLRIFRFLWNGLSVDPRGKEDVRPGLPRVHPTQKPAALMRWCLDEMALRVGARVVDPYMGSGSTGVACIQRGFRFVGCEIEPQYFKAAVERLEASVAQPSFLGPPTPGVAPPAQRTLFEGGGG